MKIVKILYYAVYTIFAGYCMVEIISSINAGNFNNWAVSALLLCIVVIITFNIACYFEDKHKFLYKQFLEYKEKHGVKDE